MHIRSQPTVWSDKAAFLPRMPWYDDVPVVPLADLPLDAYLRDKAVVTLVHAHGVIAVRHGKTWMGHVLGASRPDGLRRADHLARAAGHGQAAAAAAAAAARQQACDPLADPVWSATFLHALGPVGLRAVRRAARPTGGCATGVAGSGLIFASHRWAGMMSTSTRMARRLPIVLVVRLHPPVLSRSARPRYRRGRAGPIRA